MTVTDTVRTAVRSLLAAPLHLAVNLCGLTLALASCLILIGYLAQQLTADSWIRASGSTYRLETFESYPGRAPLEIARAPGAAADALSASFPQIATITRAYAADAAIFNGDMPVSQDILAVDPNFPDFMGLQALAGDAASALDDPSAFALPRSMALKLFGGVNDAMGKTVSLMLHTRRDLTVRLVYEDLPAASHLPSRPLIPMDAFFSGSTDEAFLGEWAGARFHTYLRLRDDTRVEDIEARLPGFVDRSLPSWVEQAVGLKPHEFMRFRLMPVEDIRFHGAPLAALKSAGNPAMLWVFGAVALLILLVAMSNFLNLSMVRTQARSREIALRRTMGADRRRILTMFTAETCVVFGIASLAAILLSAASRPVAYAFLDTISSGSLIDHPLVLAGFGALALASALLAGTYPALILGRIPPAQLLATGGKQTTGASGNGRHIFQLLVGGQFLIAIALGGVTGAMALQLRHVQTADPGFNPRSLLIIRDIDKLDSDARKSLIERSRQAPGVESVALAAAAPGDSTDWSEANIAIFPPGEAAPVQTGYRPVGQDFLATYAVPPVTGSGFPATRYGIAPTDPAPALINLSALSRLGFSSPQDAPGSVLSLGEQGGRSVVIVGVVPDIRFRDLRRETRDEIYVLEPDKAARTLAVRYRPDMATAALDGLTRVWRDIAPGRPLQFEFLHETLRSLYAGETMRMRLMGVFAALAGFIAAMGLFALSSHAAADRRREMALRKSLGATTQQIMSHMLARTAMPVMIASLLAMPVAFFAARTWLEGFTSRIDLTPAPFLLAGVAALLIALITVSGHAIRVARTHPALALREE